MFNRGRSRYSSPSRRKKRKPISPWTIVVSIPLILLALEILARLGSGFFEKKDDELSREAIAYSLKFVDDDQKVYQGLDNRGELLAQESIATGYKLVGDQKSNFFSLNEQGFRDNDPLPLAKPKGEIRVFILGNSTAFGRGTPDNQQTIANFLEQRLQTRVQSQKQNPASYRPDVFPFFQPSRQKLLGMPAKIKQGNYRVINVAVPGYSSGNELAQLALEILPYQPDVVILLNGYEDLILPNDMQGAEIPKLAEFAKDPDAYFRKYLQQSLREKAEKSALIKAVFALTSQQKKPQVGNVLSIRERNEEPLAQQLPQSDEEFQIRLDRYNTNLKRFISLCSSAQIPLMVAIQPEITGRSPDKLDAAEQNLVEQLGESYTSKVENYYPKMVDSVKQLEKDFPTNVKMLDFYRLNEKFPTPTFIDPVHINEAANEEMADQIYAAIANLPKMQIIPENFYLDK